MKIPVLALVLCMAWGPGSSAAAAQLRDHDLPSLRHAKSGRDAEPWADEAGRATQAGDILRPGKGPEHADAVVSPSSRLRNGAAGALIGAAVGGAVFLALEYVVVEHTDHEQDPIVLTLVVVPSTALGLIIGLAR